MNKNLLKINGLIKSVIEVMGYKLWGCEFGQNGHRSVLRVYLDAEKNVTLDDCAKVSNQISGVLDVENLIAGSYDLEVSSPGLDCVLFTEEQYQKFIGAEVLIKLRVPLHERRNFRGRIINVLNGEITIVVDNEAIVLSIANIEKTKVIPEF